MRRYRTQEVAGSSPASSIAISVDSRRRWSRGPVSVSRAHTTAVVRSTCTLSPGGNDSAEALRDTVAAAAKQG